MGNVETPDKIPAGLYRNVNVIGSPVVPLHVGWIYIFSLDI